MKKQVSWLFLVVAFLSLNQVQAEVLVTVSPSSGFNATMGLGANANTSSPEHAENVQLEPENPYRFLSHNDPIDLDGHSTWGEVNAPWDRLGWDVEKLTAESRVNIYGKIGIGGPGTSPPPDYDVKVAVVDLQLDGTGEMQEVPGPDGGAMEITGIELCALQTSNLPVGSEVTVSVLAGSLLISESEDGPFGTTLLLSEAGGDFYLYPPTSGAEDDFSIIEARYEGLDGGIAKDVIVVAFLAGGGGGRHVIQITAWIPFDHIDDPNPFDPDRCYKADGDGAFTKGRTSFRMRQTATVVPLRADDKTVAKNGLLTSSSDVGETIKFETSSSVAGAPPKLTAAALADKVKGVPMMVDKAFASKKNMKITSSRGVVILQDVITVHFKASGKDPLIAAPAALVPAIDWDVKVILDATFAGIVSYNISGSHDGFPAYDIYIDKKLVYKHDPRVTGEGPGSLVIPMEHSIDPKIVKGAL